MEKLRDSYREIYRVPRGANARQEYGQYTLFRKKTRSPFTTELLQRAEYGQYVQTLQAATRHVCSRSRTTAGTSQYALA